MQPSATHESTDMPLTGAEFSRLMDGIGMAGGLPERLGVAVSGGADSMCLALLANDWATARGADVLALIVDHGLRPESSDEATRTADRLTQRGIKNRILTWKDGLSANSALQERARDARYRLMGGACRQAGIDHLLLAHHQGDQAETFVMRLSKGSGLSGLGAMAKVSERGGLTLLRPLLDVPKTRLVATLSHKGQDWIEDPSNRNPAFERVRARSLLKGLDREGLNEAHFAHAANSCARISGVLDGYVQDAIGSWTEMDKGRVRLSLQPFLDAPKPLQIKVLSCLIQNWSGLRYAPKGAKVERLCDWIVGGSGGSAHTLGGCLFRRSGSDLLMMAEKPRSAPLAPAAKMAYIQGGTTAPPGSAEQSQTGPQLANRGI